MERLRVLLVDDDAFTRVTLATTLRALGFAVVADAESASSAMRAVRHSPDVAMLDLDLGEGPTGIDLAIALRAALPEIGIVMLSAYQDPRLMGQRQPALPPGTIYLVKGLVGDPEILGRAVRMAADPATHTAATQSMRDVPEPALAALRDQQVEIMRLVALGCANAEIARRQHLNEPSVEKAIARLIKHFDIRADPEQNQRVMIAQLYFRLAGTVGIHPD